jgi:CHAT domain-containing protein
MPDWKRFRQTVQAGNQLAKQLQIIHQIEAWLELPVDNAVAAIRQDIGDEERACLLRNTLSVIRLKLQRDAKIPSGPEAQRHMQELFAAVDEGRASESDRSFAQRMVVSWQLSQALIETYPSLATPVSKAEAAQSRLREAISGIFAQIAAIPPTAIVPGSVKLVHLTELRRILSEYRNLEAATDAHNPALPELYWHMGSAARMLANGSILLGRNSDGRDWYEKAADWFGKSGSPSEVDDCHRRADDLNSRLEGNLDSPTQHSLGDLLTAADPLSQAVALAELVNTRLSVDDFLEAGRYAENAADALDQAGFRDPLPMGLDAAFNTWIGTAAASAVGLAFERRILQVLTLYAAILNARCSASLHENPKRADQAYKMLRAMDPLTAHISAEAKSANDELEREWVVYFPEAATAPTETDTVVSTPQQPMTALDDALLEVRQECNRRTAAGGSQEDLIATAIQLQSRAAALGMPLYEAKACLERAYVLGHLGRPAELLDASRQGQALLLAGRLATLASLSQSVERELYLQALRYQAMAQAMMGDFATSFAICEETIRDIERIRYHVNSPFQQSAFLAQVKFFYTTGAFTAFKLQRWDAMLECMELLKARTAIHSRLTEDPPGESFAKLAKQFRETSDALDRARVAGADDDELATRRRWLRDMLAISRAPSAERRGGSPDLRLANIQAALAQDEAAINYFWLTDTTILVLLVDSTRFHAERINLQSAQRQALDEFLVKIQQISAVSTKGRPKAWHAMDRVVAPLGAILFPAFCQNFITGKKRLILSPNQGLHLFPFHAARCEDEFLGVCCAVRYVPNLGSLLLQWNGCSDGGVLAIGVPECHVRDYGAVANAEAEVDQIRQYYEARHVPVDVLIGEDATRGRIEQMRVEGKLQRYRCLHLATHGVSVFESPTEPMESRLLLYRSELDSMDIAELKVGAEIAVLSACNSGQRAFARGTQELAGDDIFGLQQALFQSGVRTVLGSLWPVATESAKVIVTAFHRHFAAGATAETALQHAVTEYLRDAEWRHVYYWAPFFLTSLGSMAPPRPAPL